MKVLWFSLPLLLAGVGNFQRALFIGLLGLFPAELLVASILSSQETIPALISKRRRVRFGWLALAIVFLISAMLFSWQSIGVPATPPEISDQFAESLFGFLMIGAVLGAVFRHCCGRLAFKAVTGRATLEAALSVIYVWTLAVFLFPTNPRHVGFGAYYVLGIASGVLIHTANRTRSRRDARFRRRVHNLSLGWLSTAELSQNEQRAITLLADEHRFPELLNQIEEWRIDAETQHRTLSERLQVVKFSVRRLLGDYESAISVPPPTSESYVYLSLLRALNCADAGKEEVADEQLAQLFQTPRGSSCAAVNATIALRDAERALENLETFSPTREPLDRINKALDLRQKALQARPLKTSPPSAPVEFGIPVTSFLTDSTGCCLLAAGLLGEARLYFNACIEADPDYSAAYLHLGDFFVLSVASGQPAARGDNDAVWQACLCYQTAIFLEGRLPSRIKRKARMRLKFLAKQLLETVGRNYAMQPSATVPAVSSKQTAELKERLSELEKQKAAGTMSTKEENELARVVQLLASGEHVRAPAESTER